MNTLLIKEASFDNHKYTPNQWQRKLEQQNVSKKQQESKLRCPDGCLLKFTKAYQYYKGQKEIHVQAHFSHICQERESKCLYVKKYGKHNGESEEHLEAKRMISTKDVTFKRICKHPCCENHITVSPDMSWTAKTEVRLNDRWLSDVVYYGPDDEIKCVIEIKHKHGVDGEKRNWLLSQSFEYMEVSTNEDIEKREYVIIDMKDDYYCMDSEFYQCHTEKEQIDNYFVNWCLRQDLTKGFWYLYQLWGDEECINGFSGDWDHCENVYGYCFYTQEKDETLEEKFNSFPILVHAQERALERDQSKWQQRMLMHKKRKSEVIALRNDWLMKWKHSEINKYLNTIEPRLITQSKQVKGINLLLVAYIYPHQINWILGYDVKTATWRKWIDTHSKIYDFCYSLTSGREIKMFSRRKYTTNIYGMSHPFTREVIPRIKKWISNNLGRYLNTKSIYDMKCKR